MTIGSPSSVPFDVRVQATAQREARVEGDLETQMIEQSRPPPVGQQGQGSRINTYG